VGDNLNFYRRRGWDGWSIRCCRRRRAWDGERRRDGWSVRSCRRRDSRRRRREGLNCGD